MDCYYLNYLIIGLIFLLVVIFIIWEKRIEKYESVPIYEPITSWDLLDPIKYSGDCYKQSRSQCLRIRNCGLADGKCVPGDYNGPYFSANNNKWIYKDNINGNVKAVRPYNKMIKCNDFQYNNFVGI